MNAIRADITTLNVDAIVNAANSSLLGGGGVDGAIHRAAGPDLVHECRLLGGCKTGEAKITKGYQLPARFVIHTVGPVWNGGGARVADLLASCYRNSLRLAVEHGLKTIAFPSISTGIYGYPVEEAASIAIDVVAEHDRDNPGQLQVTFCCYSQKDLDIYQKILAGSQSRVSPVASADLADRRAGCLLGLATGDALGTTLEFTRPGNFKPMTDMVGGGPFHLEAGQWTDDTSMALCLAASLIECGFNLRDQIERFVRWWKEGYFSSTGTCFDIGNTVSAALRAFMRTGEPVSGNTDPYSAGNGSIMRLAPVPLFFQNADDCIHFSGESSRTTHQAPTAMDACKYLGGILWGLLHGASKAEVLAPMYHPSGSVWTNLDPAISEIAMGSFKVKEPPEIRGSGYVVASLEAALWAFHKSESFEEGALLAVNLGEDADTTGAVFGQIAGAFYGKSGIPGRWLQQLHDRELMERMVQQLIGPDKANP